jgi:hypothetical protein
VQSCGRICGPCRNASQDQFHACTNCSFDRNWEYEFCSEGCRDKAKAEKVAELVNHYNVTPEALEHIYEEMYLFLG